MLVGTLFPVSHLLGLVLQRVHSVASQSFSCQHRPFPTLSGYFLETQCFSVSGSSVFSCYSCRNSRQGFNEDFDWGQFLCTSDLLQLRVAASTFARQWQIATLHRSFRTEWLVHYIIILNHESGETQVKIFPRILRLRRWPRFLASFDYCWIRTKSSPWSPPLVWNGNSLFPSTSQERFSFRRQAGGLLQATQTHGHASHSPTCSIQTSEGSTRLKTWWTCTLLGLLRLLDALCSLEFKAVLNASTTTFLFSSSTFSSSFRACANGARKNTGDISFLEMLSGSMAFVFEVGDRP